MRTHLLGAAIAAALLGSCAAPRPPPRAASAIGRPLALVAPGLDGAPVDVAAAAAGRVRVVDFWATWCEPCRAELPALAALARELGPRGLSVYAVSFDEDAAQVAPFLAELKADLPVLWDQGGDALSARFEIERLPTTLVVDRRGLVRHVHVGYSEDIGRELRGQVERLLAEP